MPMPYKELVKIFILKFIFQFLFSVRKFQSINNLKCLIELKQSETNGKQTNKNSCLVLVSGAHGFETNWS